MERLVLRHTGELADPREIVICCNERETLWRSFQKVNVLLLHAKAW